MPSWSDRPQKNIARDKALNVSGPKSSVIFLPGYDCCDVKQAITSGLIDKKSNVVLVEKDLKVYDKIRSYIDDEWIKGWNLPKLHRGTIAELKLNQKIDYAFFDLCGNLCRVDDEWCQKVLLNSLLDGADLSFTFSLQTRGNDYIRTKLKTFKPETKEDIAQFATMLVSKKMRDRIIDYRLYFKDLFKDFSFKNDFYPYKDGKTHMILCNLRNLKRNDKKEKANDSKTMAHMFLNAVSPVQKSAYTKALNKLLALRETEGFNPIMVHAGIKAWITRFKNQKIKENL